MLNSIRKEIQKCINAGERKYVIAPFGFWGKETKRILNDEYNIKEIFCIDNKQYDGINIFSVDHMPRLENDFTILIVAENEYYRYQLIDSICKYVDPEKIKICIKFKEQQEKIFTDSSKVKLDFLCVGFAKCGTTSMQTALMRHPRIYLPKEKETFFIKNVNEETHQKFKESYQAEKVKDRLAGGIEPTYFMNAEAVYKYFGGQLKIIICISNPMRALYSYFKMAMRDMGNQESEYLKKYKKVTPELFDEWLDEKLYLYQYMDYIKFYLSFFPRSQIRIIVSELLYASPKDNMNELQDFLGIEKQNMLIYDEFPHSNKGSRVAKSYAAACVNKRIWNLITETKDLETEMQIRKIRHEIFKITTEPYEQPMSETTYHRLFQYYRNGISELEKFLNISLRGVWYE